MLEISVNKEGLLSILKKQINSFYSLSAQEYMVLKDNLDSVLSRIEYNFSNINNKYYSINWNTGGVVTFNHLHSGQYITFLYYLSNSIYKKTNDIALCDKIYGIIRIIGCIDLFYVVDLPDIFFLDHPVGSVIGRGSFSNYFSFVQNCTIGQNKGIYPEIGEFVRMCPNSIILGKSKIGNNVILSTGTIIKDQDVPDNSIVFGQSPNLIIKTYTEETMKKYFDFYI